MRFLARLIALFAVLLPMQSVAYDPARPPGYGSPDMYRPNVDGVIARSDSTRGNFPGAQMKLPDTGAILRSLQDKLKDQVDVEDFSAKCDGGTDDTTAIRKTVAALVARGRGGFINFPPRACIVSGTINGGPNIYFRGKGREATAILINVATGNVFQFGTAASAYNNFGIFDMLIGSTVPRTDGALIAISGSRGTFQTVGLRGGYDGLTIDNYGNQAVVNVSDLLAEDMTNECVSLGRSSHLFANGLHLSGSTLAQCGTSMAIYSASGVYVRDVESYQAKNNAFVFSPSTTHIGIQGVWFNQTLADSSAANGWFFGGTGKIAEVKITASQASSSGAHGLTIEPGTKLDSLVLTDFQSTFNGKHGARIGGGTNVTVRGGEFYYNGNGAGGVGISVENNVKGFSIMGINSGLGGWAKLNITDLINRGKPMKQTHCVYVAGPANDNYIVRDNMCMGNTSGGSQIFDGGTGNNKSVGGNIAY